MEGFSDGVYGFAATLLVLDLAVHPPGTPLQQVLHAWPGYLAYLVSFLTIGVSWLLHTALTDQLARDRSAVPAAQPARPARGGVPAIPDPAHRRRPAGGKLDTSSERVYVTMYGLTLLAITLLGSALDAYARYQHLYSPAKRGRGTARPTQRGSFCPSSSGT